MEYLKSLECFGAKSLFFSTFISMMTHTQYTWLSRTVNITPLSSWLKVTSQISALSADEPSDYPRRLFAFSRQTLTSRCCHVQPCHPQLRCRGQPNNDMPNTGKCYMTASSGQCTSGGSTIGGSATDARMGNAEWFYHWTRIKPNTTLDFVGFCVVFISRSCHKT